MFADKFCTSDGANHAHVQCAVYGNQVQAERGLHVGPCNGRSKTLRAGVQMNANRKSVTGRGTGSTVWEWAGDG